MTYQTLRLGSSGDGVKTLQELLNQAGFSLDADGVYGGKTANAVVEYQTANRLTADGVAGEETLASLYTAYGDRLGGAVSALGVRYDPDTATESGANVEYLEKNAPGAYVSPYAEQIEQLLNQVLGREEFSYDPDTDENYKRIRDLYAYNARRAREDTVGSINTQTGGYANSYAAAAGDQAYQNAMMQVNGEIPEMYQRALNAYTARGDALTKAIDTLTGREAESYDRYQDEMKQYADALAYYYRKLQDEQDQANWQAEFDKAAAKKTSSAKKASTGSESVAAKPVAAVASVQQNVSNTANLLTRSEFARRKAAGAKSLAQFADYEAYLRAHKA